MDNEKYIEDLCEIKDIMNRTTQFIFLSGLSGISTGIIALAGVFISFKTVFKDQDYLVYNPVEIISDNRNHLLLIAGGTLFLSIVSAIFFTRRKTNMHNQSIWGFQTKLLITQNKKQ